MREELLKELSIEEGIMTILLSEKVSLETYDEKMAKNMKDVKEKIITYVVVCLLIDFFSSKRKLSSTLVIITLFSLIEVIIYSISKFRAIKRIEDIDIEMLEMDMYNSEEKMKGLSKAIFAEMNYPLESEDKDKVFCKK